jgi:hypothetical protein
MVFQSMTSTTDYGVIQGFDFVSRNATRAKAKKAAYRWQHPEHVSLTLKKDDGFSWAEMSDKRNRLF